MPDPSRSDLDAPASPLPPSQTDPQGAANDQMGLGPCAVCGHDPSCGFASIWHADEVLDQQEWVSPDVHALQIRAWEAKVASLPDPHAAEPVPPVGTASLLGTPHEMTVEYTINDDGLHLVCSCGRTFGLHFSPSPAEIAAAAEAHSGTALREAARYEQVGWLIPESECGDGVDPGDAVVSPDEYYGDERDVPLYRRVTTAGDGS